MGCCDCSEAAKALATRRRKVLYVVLGLNAVMFLVELTAGVLARSSALLGDSLDMLGDALAYGLTLYALDRGARWKANAAFVKGALMGFTGVAALAAAIARMSIGAPPIPEPIGAVGVAALLVNAACLALLMRHRGDDVNLRSAWICSRNDLITNVAVIAAGVLVGVTGSAWPDFIVGFAIAGLFLVSAARVLRDAGAARQKAAQEARAAHLQRRRLGRLQLSTPPGHP